MYRFKSRATSDVLMHAAVGHHILSLLGKDPATTGVLRWQDMAHAQQVLLVAAQTPMQADPSSVGHGDKTASPEDPWEEAADHPTAPTAVTLAQRLVPFLATLKRCEAAQKDMTWEV
jgi:cyclopropane-fatty-acyl-phospholipid synthase